MSRTLPLSLLVTALALAFGGCSDADDESDSVAASPPVTEPATASSPPATTATDSASASPHVITVTGTGEASGTPDTAQLTLGVEVRGATTSEAVAAARDATDALLEVLRAVPVPEDQLQTTALSVYPTYVYDETGTGTPTGYVANVTMSVRTSIDEAGAIVDDAAAAVGDALRVQGLTWSVSDPDALLAEARSAALADAREVAAALSEAAGLELGGIVSIATGGMASLPYAAGEGDVSAIPFEPGQATVSTSVTVTFELLAA